MQFDIITLFPEMFSALNYGITGRAMAGDLLRFRYWNPRDFTKNKHRKVDDHPYGGGPGMVMIAQPLCDAVLAAKKANPQAKTIYLSPQGKKLNQSALRNFAQQGEGLILIAGRYEGIDERIISSIITEERSIGDYVLSGGELAAMVMIDGITRLLPGALGNENSAEHDSFMKNGLLDYPHYTRPEIFNGQKVPDVLLSGNHETIAKWRLRQSLARTYLRRPDLINKINLTEEEQKLLLEEVFADLKNLTFEGVLYEYY
jgi:tRNA (guanine37-N1)-methyltransferase